MMKNKILNILILTIALFSLSSVTAVEVDDIYKYNTQINYVKPCFNNGGYCSGSATCRLTVVNPNTSVILNNVLMTNQGAYHNYSIPNQTNLGIYSTSISCSDAGLNGSQTFTFSVSGNGKEEPEGIVIVLFSIGFVLIMGYLIYMMLYSIAHLIRLDLDILDLALNIGGYFALLSTYMLEVYYVGNLQIETFIEYALMGTAVTNVIVPIVAFFIGVVMQSPLGGKKSR